MNPVGHESSETAGTRWLGEVPSHWRITRLKNAADYWVSNVDKVSSEGEEPVRLCNYTDVYYNERIHPHLSLMQTTAAAAEIRRFHLQVGDVVITKDSEEWNDIAVPALVTDTAPDLVCGYHLAIIRPRPSRLYGPFLLRLFQAAGVNTQLQVSASGITRYSLPKSAIGETLISLPPIGEQRLIADFLDRETARIDALVSMKRKLLCGVDERVSDVVEALATKGRGPEALDAPGSVRLKFLLRSIEQGWSPQCDNSAAADGQWGVLKTGCVNGGRFNADENKALPADLEPIPSLEISAGDVLMSRANTKELLGSAAFVEFARPKLLLCDKLYRLRTLPDVLDPEFLVLSLGTSLGRYQLERDATGTSASMQNIGQDTVRNLRIPLLALPEQHDILKKARRIRAGAITLHERVLKAIDDLEKYRAALISAAVTGQIDVRNYHTQEAAALCQ